jgi:hypothetical protein
MARQDRNWEIHRRRVRRDKLAKLRRRYAKARTNDERNRVIAKLRKVAPTLAPDQFIALATAKAA